jgi:PDDEXK-like domain of unknown function (DUF3799)
MKPGVYTVPAAAYYADQIKDSEPSLNASVLKHLITDTPKHAWTHHPRLNPAYQEKGAAKFDVGTTAHALFLQGETITLNDDAFTIDDADVRVATQASVDGKPFALIVSAADWRTKAAQQVRDHARDRGLVPLLTDQWLQTQALAQRLRRQLPLIEADPPLFTAGKAEQVLVWRDEGVLCRARLDWLHDSLECVDDLKTTAATANPHTWARTTMWNIGADIQAAFTLRGLRSALGVDSTFRFLIAEVNEPYAVAAVTPGPQALALSNAKIDAGLARWRRCLADNAWPAFPPQILTIDPPEWLAVQWAERQMVDDELERAA